MLNAPWVHLVVASWFVIAAFAQTNTSSIAGVVSDASGSVIPNATITVTQAESGFERQTASSTSGDFVLPQLPPGKYFMNDDVRARLVEALAKQNFAGMTPGLQADLLRFYSDPNAPYATRRKPKEWAKLQAALQQLKSTSVSAQSEASPF